ncbi:hypothetical protein [Bradyrhizobium sp. Tv2a-2]|uniref:hypothetical protein n=1 Tax=Bradyrhizobium sp. Tv2a-2 TaxID=113395 RepID=UPI00041868EB|nr:hypothetical protein [Bradyrhizobium sp. Tv2a-2]
MPHHLHISGFAMFLFVMALGFALWFIVSMRRSRLEAELERERIKADANRPVVNGTSYADRSGYTRSGFTAAPSAPPAGPAYLVPPVAAQSPVYVNNGNGSGDFLTGMLVGEALGGGFGHHGTTIVENNTFIDSGPSYVDSSPSFDSGISLDSGGGCDTGGGIDISW